MSGGAPVLVIKLGALGDFFMADGVFRAIAAHHAERAPDLLTIAPLTDLATRTGYFSEVLTDRRTAFSYLSVPRLIARRGYRRIYDLQSNPRTRRYARLTRLLTAGRCDWLHTGLDNRDHVHRVALWERDLRAAGISADFSGDFGWLTAPIEAFELPQRYALLVPGSSPLRPDKRWPAERYAELAGWLADAGITPVIIGGEADRDSADAIAGRCAAAVNLAGRTSLAELAGIGRGALAAVGNDTGPMHILAGVGCPCLTLFSGSSDPVRVQPRGPHSEILRAERLEDLPASRVREHFPAALQ